MDFTRPKILRSLDDVDRKVLVTPYSWKVTDKTDDDRKMKDLLQVDADTEDCLLPRVLRTPKAVLSQAEMDSITVEMHTFQRRLGLPKKVMSMLLDKNSSFNDYLHAFLVRKLKDTVFAAVKSKDMEHGLLLLDIVRSRYLPVARRWRIGTANKVAILLWHRGLVVNQCWSDLAVAISKNRELSSSLRENAAQWKADVWLSEQFLGFEVVEKRSSFVTADVPGLGNWRVNDTLELEALWHEQLKKELTKLRTSKRQKIVESFKVSAAAWAEIGKKHSTRDAAICKVYWELNYNL